MKNLELNKLSLAASAAILLLAGVTAVLAVTLPQQRGQRYNLTFPDTAGGADHHEWRILPARDSLAERSRLVVEELLLGPVELGAVPFIPEETTLRSVVVDEKTMTLYLDFSPELVVGGSTDAVAFEEAVDLIHYNLHRNLRRLNEIVVTVEGQLPGVPRFEGI